MVAAVGNSLLLTSGEMARLFLIVVGLAYLYFRNRGRGADDGSSAEFFRHGVSLFGLVMMLVLVQFDPDFIRTRGAGEGQVNWFSLLSSVAVLIGFAVSATGAYMSHAESNRSDLRRLWTFLSSFDQIVILVTLSIAVYLWVVNSALPAKVEHVQASAIIKLLLCVMVYVTTLTAFRSDVQDGEGQLWRRIGEFRLAYKGMVVTLGIVLLVGGCSTAYAFANHRRGMQHLEQGKYEDALKVLKRASTVTVYRSEKLEVALGQCYLGLGLNTKAEDQFHAARQGDVYSDSVDERIGDAYSKFGLWGEAIAAYLQARTINSNPSFAYDQLSMAYLGNGDTYGLVDLVESRGTIPTLVLTSAAEKARFGIGLSLAGYTARAEELFAGALDLEPGHALALYGQGSLYAKRDAWGEAVHSLKQALISDSSLVRARYELGVVYERLNDDDGAQSEFDRLLLENPSDVLALGHLAAIHSRGGETMLAEQLMKRMQAVVLPLDWLPRGGTLAWNGSCFHEMVLSEGTVSISVQATGTQASGIWPIMDVALDDERVGSVSVVGGGTFEFIGVVRSEGRKRLSVSFVNDSTPSETGDRNLFVGKAVIRYASINPSGQW